MASAVRYFLGCMSGTSADGVDVCVCAVTAAATDAGTSTHTGAARAHRQYAGGVKVEVLAHSFTPYPSALRSRIFALRAGSSSIAEVAALAHAITHTHTAAIRQLMDRLAAEGSSGGRRITLEDVTAVGVHGQTVFHAPPITCQLFVPARLSQELRVRVVSDFRSADCAAGGTGAPLVPFADWAMHTPRSANGETDGRVLVNLGGIANITWLKLDARVEDIIAFDTGPANAISDALIRVLRGDTSDSSPGYDVNGALAATGRVNSPLLHACAKHAYFHTLPPKSTDVTDMLRIWDAACDECGVDWQVGGGTPRPDPHPQLADAVATACWLTATTLQTGIAAAAERACKDAPPGSGPDAAQHYEIVLSGGGAANPFLVQCIRSCLTGEPEGMPLVRLPPAVRIRSVTVAGESSSVNVHISAREAAAFALLAAAACDRVPANVLSVTGAARPVICGSITDP